MCGHVQAHNELHGGYSLGENELLNTYHIILVYNTT